MTDHAPQPPSDWPPPLPEIGAPLAPVAPQERLSSVDTLRGFAVLGILAMNIVTFALPGDSYMDPMHPALLPYQGAFEGSNRTAWWLSFLLFDQKMMSIFSMLFGAGLVLMGGRAERFAGRYYTRLGWLFIIGMLHAYLIWYGDILVAYAICGVFLYPVRRFRAWALIVLGVLIMLVEVGVNGLIGLAMNHLRVGAAEAQAVLEAGGTLNASQQGTLDGYQKMLEGMSPSVEKIDGLVAAMRGSVVDVLKANGAQAVIMQTFLFFIWTLWRALGLMLVGMGLMKLGVFAAARSVGVYVAMALVGVPLGLSLTYMGGVRLIEHQFNPVDAIMTDWHFNYVGSFFTALGYVGLVMLWCKLGGLSWLRRRLAAVGRMALTNYLMQSILMTFVFYGWGLGYFGHVERGPLFFFVFAVWALQLIWSPIWLARFRYGPAEWAWRSLTYMKKQPMRLEPGVRS